MAGWVLVSCLQCLREELDLLAPRRDKKSDGALGDRAHAAAGTSDHLPDEEAVALRAKDSDNLNEVHAIDVDQDGPWPAGWSMERIVQTIVLNHRAGRDNRLQNVIYRSRIWSASWGWTARKYTGANDHSHHAHFSARYTTAQERDTRPWGIATPAKPAQEEYVMASKDDVKTALREVLTEQQPYQANPGKRLATAGWGNVSIRTILEYLLEDATVREATGAQLDAFRAEVVTALAAISADPGNDIQLTDRQVGVIGERLAAGINVQAIATAVNDDTSRRMQQ